MFTSKFSRISIVVLSLFFVTAMYSKNKAEDVKPYDSTTKIVYPDITRPDVYYQWSKAERKQWDKEHKDAFKAHKKEWDKNYDSYYKELEKAWEKKHKDNFAYLSNVWQKENESERAKAWESYLAENASVFEYPADFDKWTKDNQKALRKQKDALIKEKRKDWEKRCEKEYKVRKKAWEKQQKIADKAEKKAWKKDQKAARKRAWEQYLYNHNYRNGSI